MLRVAPRWWIAGGVLVLAVVAVLVVVPRVDDFSGHCIGDAGITEGLAERLDLPVVVTDPLHLTARVPDADGPRLGVGTPVTVPGGLVPPPSTYADVVAVAPAGGGELAVTMALRPLDQVGGFPGTPPMPTMTPGARGTVTALIRPVGKTEAFSVDSLRPPPQHVPGPATIWYADDPATGTMHPGRIVVTRIIDGRVLYSDPAGTIPDHTPGGSLGIVLPDHRCRTHGVWPPILLGGRAVDPYSGAVEPTP